MMTHRPHGHPPRAGHRLGRHLVHGGDNLELLRRLPDNSVDAVVTDPPYGLGRHPDAVAMLRDWLDTGYHKVKGTGFMGRRWDAFVPQPVLWREVARVLRPGGHLVAFFGARTYDVGTLAIRLAGLEVRDCLFWCYGCVDRDTQVLTPSGWRNHDEIHKGSAILGYDPEQATVEWMHAEDLHVYDYEDVAYRIVGPGVDQLLSRGHRCIIERDGAWQGARVEDLARKRETRLPVLEGLPDLPVGLPDARPVPGDAEQDVFPGVQRASAFWAEAVGAQANEQTGRPECRVLGVWHGDVEAERLAQEGIAADLLQGLQRQAASFGPCEAQPQGPIGLDGDIAEVVPRQNVRAEEPGVAWRRDENAREGQLPRGRVCSMPSGVRCHGAQERVRGGTPLGGRAGARAVPHSGGVRAPHEPRPVGQPAGELSPVPEQQGAQAIRVARLTRANLARVEEVHYKGVMWCPTVRTGAIVCRRNGHIFITGNSGFPKSHNVAIALDKLAGVMGHRGKAHHAYATGDDFEGRDLAAPSDVGDHVPITDAAKRWDGWGTALKPALEPIALCRLPPSESSIARNVLRWGTGGINVGGGRIGTHEAIASHHGTGGGQGRTTGAWNQTYTSGDSGRHNTQTAGRWPANLIHDGSPEAVAGMPETGDDGGSAARYFYSAKTSPAERAGSRHPTIKPLALMRYLVRLVTPPGGVVLDPYLGSGTTLLAAEAEGVTCYGAEAEHLEDILHRWEHRHEIRRASEGVQETAGGRDEHEAQGELFPGVAS